jgi:phosphatidylserine decarboxylase
VEELLADRLLAGSFDGGAVIIIRLGLADYHHVHFPDDGIPGHAEPVAGAYHAGGPYAASGVVPFFARNYRMRTVFHSAGFGPFAMVEVGAFTVGSIVQTYTDHQPVRRGDRKAYFELGGSTVVLVFRPGMFRPDPDLVLNTAAGLETSVRLGESIGRSPS